MFGLLARRMVRVVDTFHSLSNRWAAGRMERPQQAASPSITRHHQASPASINNPPTGPGSTGREPQCGVPVRGPHPHVPHPQEIGGKGRCNHQAAAPERNGETAEQSRAALAAVDDAAACGMREDGCKSRDCPWSIGPPLGNSAIDDCHSAHR